MHKEVRVQVLTLAHDAVMAGHLGVKKTLDRITSCFYWPGRPTHGDVQCWCRSSDICQRTTPKGKVAKIPLGRLPRIDIPFKRVAVDLIGPNKPISEKGNSYVLTLVDFATRYPEAVPLKSITTEVVAKH